MPCCLLYKRGELVSVTIHTVVPKSPCAKKRFKAGDILVSINSNQIDDLLDYQFYSKEKNPVFEVMSGGKRRIIKLSKQECQETGLEFETYLMDKQRHCKNKCIFCFIDQLPRGLRESLYFKDDDTRLSFLFGNYITLTNLTAREAQRIIEMHISPVNISVHTMNPELRSSMMRNPSAGDSLKYIKQFADAGIKINTQLVLCPGINDGAELVFSLNELGKMFPAVQSIAAVPVGLTDHRNGLYEMESFNKHSAKQVLNTIDAYNAEFSSLHAEKIAYPADEFYLLAGQPFPAADYYDDFYQLENGVGMSALFREECFAALRGAANAVDLAEKLHKGPRNISIATGEAAYPLIKELVDETVKKWHNLKVKIFVVKNNFFGGRITVAGLLTGRDLTEQLAAGELGDELLIPAAALRREGDLFLDNLSIDDLSRQLNTKVTAVKNSGIDFLSAIFGRQV